MNKTNVQRILYYIIFSELIQTEKFQNTLKPNVVKFKNVSQSRLPYLKKNKKNFTAGGLIVLCIFGIFIYLYIF